MKDRGGRLNAPYFYNMRRKNGNTTVNVTVENKEVKSGKGKTVALLLLLIASFFGGAIFERKNTPSPTEKPPVYIKGDTVKILVSTPEPVYVSRPADTADIIMAAVKKGKFSELFPKIKEDSLVYVPTSEDTLAIIRDWATVRVYEKTVLDNDTLGFAKVTATVQYNRIDSLGAVVVPVIKKVPYEIPPKKISPFVATGVSTQPSFIMEGGLIFDGKWGGALMYQRDLMQKKNAYGLMVVRKF